MTRLRYSLEEARDKAEFLATEFVASQGWGHRARCKGTIPSAAAQGKNPKHPTVWNVCFVFHPPDVIMDGGELFVSVDLETEVVKEVP